MEEQEAIELLIKIFEMTYCSYILSSLCSINFWSLTSMGLYNGFLTFCVMAWERMAVLPGIHSAGLLELNVQGPGCRAE